MEVELKALSGSEFIEDESDDEEDNVEFDYTLYKLTKEDKSAKNQVQNFVLMIQGQIIEQTFNAKIGEHF